MLGSTRKRARGPVLQGREQIKQQQKAPRPESAPQSRGATHVPSPPVRARSCAPARSPDTRVRRWQPRAAGAPRVSGRGAPSGGRRLRLVGASGVQVRSGEPAREGSGPGQEEPVEAALRSPGVRLLHSARGHPCVRVRGCQTLIHIPQLGVSWGSPAQGRLRGEGGPGKTRGLIPGHAPTCAPHVHSALPTIGAPGASGRGGAGGTCVVQDGMGYTEGPSVEVMWEGEGHVGTAWEQHVQRPRGRLVGAGGSQKPCGAWAE